MALFMEHHDDLKLPHTAIEAPDADAVRKHHEALGVPCGDVHPVNKLL